MGERYGLFFEEFPADYPEKSRALLTGFALSGIQGYLFGRINGEWTPARVRRASRYVSLATEAVGAYLVRAMGGYRPHPLMMSSGKGWLLTAPGTPLEKLERELVRLKRGLFLASGGRLELEAGTVPVVLVRPGGRRLMGGPWPDGMAQVHRAMERDKFQSRALFGLDRARDRMPWLEPAALLKGEGELLPPPWARPGLLKLDLDNLGLFFSAFGTVDQREAAGQALDRAILGAVTHLEELYPLFAGGDDLLLLCPPERALPVAAALRRELERQIEGEAALEAYRPRFGLSCGCLPSFDPRLPALYYLDRAEGQLELSKAQGKDRLAMGGRTLSWVQAEELGRLLEENEYLFRQLGRSAHHYGVPQLLLQDILDHSGRDSDRAQARELLALFGREEVPYG